MEQSPARHLGAGRQLECVECILHQVILLHCCSPRNKSREKRQTLVKEKKNTRLDVLNKSSFKLNFCLAKYGSTSHYS